jgi:hypothetical protein
MIGCGFDSFIINRRSISKAHTTIEDIPLMFAEVGQSHMGYDCFVFKREDYERFNLGLTCVGAPYVGQVLLINQALTSHGFQVFHDQHVTFHLGNDRVWSSRRFRDYALYNQREFKKIMDAQTPVQRAFLRKLLARNRLQGLWNRLGDYLGFR